MTKGQWRGNQGRKVSNFVGMAGVARGWNMQGFYFRLPRQCPMKRKSTLDVIAGA